MPRAATSVATKILQRPLRTSISVRLRQPCGISPCKQLAAKPFSYSSSASVSVIALVAVKITHWSMLASRKMWSSKRFLWFRSSQYKSCSSILPCASARSISITSGFLVSLRASLPTAPSQVAENSSVWRDSGVAATMVSMSSIKPMSSMRSASSNTSTSKRSKSMRPLRMWSIRRPGVATTISIGRDKALICCPKDEPPTSVTVRTHFMFCA